MEKKVFKLGFCIGRFQPFHKGHAYMIQTGIDLCEKMIVGIGSAQESRTERNPFSYQERKEMILKEFPDAFVLPINDREHPSDDCSWGMYLMHLLNQEILKSCLETKDSYGYPDLIISGTESIRGDWFDTKVYNQTNFLFLNREKEYELSGSFIREYLLNIKPETLETHPKAIELYTSQWLPKTADIKSLTKILREANKK